jgi:hypothetical protein
MRTPVEIFDAFCAAELHPLGRPLNPSDELAGILTSHTKLADAQIAMLKRQFLPNRNIEIHVNYVDCGALGSTDIQSSAVMKAAR